MKKIKVLILGFFLSLIFIITGLFICLNSPALFYSRESIYKNFTIYHDEPISLKLIVRIDQAERLLQQSELYDPNLKYSICLNHNSLYPKLIKMLFADKIAWGYYHYIVLNGDSNFEQNFVRWKSYQWNLTQLIVHQAMLCQQYNTFGFWKSNPVANIPDWKWEGYPEFIARKKPDQTDLIKNIDRLDLAKNTSSSSHIKFADGSGISLNYYKDWLLVQFCIKVKKMSFVQLLHDQQSESDLQNEMMNWYLLQKLSEIPEKS